jgi:WD40 repeat protein
MAHLPDIFEMPAPLSVRHTLMLEPPPVRNNLPSGLKSTVAIGWPWPTCLMDLRTLPGIGSAGDVFVTRDSQFIVTTGEVGIGLWSTSTGEFVRELHSDGEIHAVALSPNSEHALVAAEGRAKLLRLDTGSTVAVLETAGNDIAAIKFSPDSMTVITGGYLGGTAHLWRTDTGEAGEQRTASVFDSARVRLRSSVSAFPVPSASSRKTLSVSRAP